MTSTSRHLAGPAAPPEAGVLDLLVAVGTDVHRFDRLMGWLEEWHERRPVKLRVLVQHGQSRAPRIPGATPFLAHDLLGDAMARARVVLTHGGPASITEARRHGHVPVVVARDPAYGEHVDDHQMLFVARMAQLGLIRRCTTAGELVATIEQALTDPAAPVAGVDGDPEADRAAAVARVGQIVDGLVAGGRNRRGFGRRR